MIRSTLAVIALLTAAPLVAQSVDQDELDARYNRALAAGYKALFVCSAMANTEIGIAWRELDQIEEYELGGIQPPLAERAAGMKAEIWRYGKGEGAIAEVTVEWAGDMPPRLAYHEEGGGCSLAPIGMEEPPERATVPYGNAIGTWTDRTIPNKVLARLVDQARGGGYGDGTRTTAVHVTRDGKLAAERYSSPISPFSPQRTWSVAKSFAATLVGVAVHRGDVEVSQSAGLGLSENDPRRAITIDHLLRMASGRYSDTPGNRTDPLYYGGSSVRETALHWPLLYKPGTVFRYANNDTLAAVLAIEGSLKSHSPDDFFDQIGIGGTRAETDWRGDYILSSQVWATARALSKFGQLYLDDGVLPDGTRILPEGWVEYVSTPSGPQPEGRSWGYGAGFWLFNNHEGIPADTFFAAGNRGQYVVIVPSRDVVIVRRGEDPVGTRFDIEGFTRDVLAALDE